MNNSNANHNTQNESSQQYLAGISRKGYQSPLIDPDDLPFTLKELVLGFWNDLEERAPPEGLADLVIKALKAHISIAKSLHDIADSHNAQPDHTDTLQRIADSLDRLADAVEKNNRLRAEEEPPQTTTEGSRPLKPLPFDRGGRYVRL